jgi:hypothetical protein
MICTCNDPITVQAPHDCELDLCLERRCIRCKSRETTCEASNE